MGKTKTILVAPLHWGLGHATRCIPVIQQLLNHQFNVIIASDGSAITLLEKEFPNLESVILPSYTIRYSKNRRFFKWKLLSQVPHLKKTQKEEHKLIDTLVDKGKIQGIISDNRPGVWSCKVPSVYLTHQLRVLSGNTTFLSTYFHQEIIKNFDQCWVPDSRGIYSLSGKLGADSPCNIPVKYLGLLHRIEKITLPIRYEYCIILSGPEPQRTRLENIMIREFLNTQKRVLLVQGKVTKKQTKKKIGSITIYNFMIKEEIEKTLNESEVVIARSGYTTLMDIAYLNKKAFFIPTPGQYEQEYLARRMEALQMAAYCNQEDFCIDKLKEVANYMGLYTENSNIDYPDLFSLFKGK